MYLQVLGATLKSTTPACSWWPVEPAESPVCLHSLIRNSTSTSINIAPSSCCLAGVGRYLKEQNQNIQLVAVEPASALTPCTCFLTNTTVQAHLSTVEHLSCHLCNHSFTLRAGRCLKQHSFAKHSTRIWAQSDPLVVSSNCIRVLFVLFAGAGRYLKEQNPSVQLVAVEPAVALALKIRTFSPFACVCRCWALPQGAEPQHSAGGSGACCSAGTKNKDLFPICLCLQVLGATSRSRTPTFSWWQWSLLRAPCCREASQGTTRSRALAQASCPRWGHEFQSI
jgi:hypothetical protein